MTEEIANIRPADSVEKIFVGKLDEKFCCDFVGCCSVEVDSMKEDQEMTIIAKDGTVKTNLRILCSTSKYFKTMMLDNPKFNESKTRAVTLKQFEIGGIYKLLTFIST